MATPGMTRLHLLHTQCTTGWADWGHGELWLTSDAIIRTANPDLTRRGVRAALRGARSTRLAEGQDAPGGARPDDELGPIPPDPDSAIDVDARTWQDYLVRARGYSRTVELPINNVLSFRSRAGPLSIALRFRLRDGKRVLFLIARQVPGRYAHRVSQVLAERLPT